MDRKRKNQLKKYFGETKELVAIVDKELKCVYSNRPKILPESSSISHVFCGDTSGLLKAADTKPAMIGGCSYSVKITPLDDELYVCCFFDVPAVVRLAENTDIYSKLFPIVDVVEFNTSALWKDLAALRSKFLSDGQDEPGYYAIAADIEKRIAALNSSSKNISEYMHMYMHNEKRKDPINLVRITKDIVNRCNTFLSDIGRCVEFVSDEQEVYIHARNRYVLSAMVNAIQNALVYSTRDCVPCLTISKRDGEAVITLVNNSALCVGEGGAENGFNFAGQRLGYGIPLIKRFAEMSGGTFELREENSTFTTLIELPLVDEEAMKLLPKQFSSGGYIYYETDIPDIVKLKMLEVIALYNAC